MSGDRKSQQLVFDYLYTRILTEVGFKRLKKKKKTRRMKKKKKKIKKKREEGKR